MKIVEPMPLCSAWSTGTTRKIFGWSSASTRTMKFGSRILLKRNCITLVDTNGNRKLYKQRQDQKIDAVAAMMDAYVAWKQNRDAFE